VSLTVEQRLDWLAVRIHEMRPWLLRAWLDLDAWTWDGEPLALGAPWPDRSGVRTLAHPVVSPPSAWAAGERPWNSSVAPDLAVP
jgi:alpha-mannosidase